LKDECDILNIYLRSFNRRTIILLDHRSVLRIETPTEYECVCVFWLILLSDAANGAHINTEYPIKSAGAPISDSLICHTLEKPASITPGKASIRLSLLHRLSNSQQSAVRNAW